MGQALHIPKEILGDVYADPYAKKGHNHGDLLQAGKSLSKAEVAALKEAGDGDGDACSTHTPRLCASAAAAFTLRLFQRRISRPMSDRPCRAPRVYHGQACQSNEGTNAHA